MKNINDTIQFILEDIISFHTELEQVFVVETGIHDRGLLESAVNAPFQTFGGVDLYPTVFDKAARLCYGLTKDHPFNDGNKRTAVHSMLVYLEVNDISIAYDREELEGIIISIADDSMSSKELSKWLEMNRQSI